MEVGDEGDSSFTKSDKSLNLTLLGDLLLLSVSRPGGSLGGSIGGSSRAMLRVLAFTS